MAIANTTLERNVSTPPSIGRDIVAGLMGAAISIICVLPPILHFVTGPLGAFFGGMVGGARVSAGPKDAAIIGATIGLILALAGWVVLGLALLVTATLPPSSVAGSPFANINASEVLTIGGAMLLYGAVLGGFGAIVGGWTKRRK